MDRHTAALEHCLNDEGAVVLQGLVAYQHAERQVRSPNSEESIALQDTVAMREWGELQPGRITRKVRQRRVRR